MHVWLDGNSANLYGSNRGKKNSMCVCACVRARSACMCVFTYTLLLRLPNEILMGDVGSAGAGLAGGGLVVVLEL